MAGTVEATARDDAVEVRVSGERLPPRVQDGQKADLGAEVFRVGSDRAQGLGGRLEEQIVDAAFVLQADLGDLLWEGEHDMEVLHRQQLVEARLQPCPLGHGLALRAVPIAARNGELTITCLMGSVG